MELKELLNAFLASPAFNILIIVLVIVAGLFIRLALLPTNKEYKHKPDKE